MPLYEYRCSECEQVSEFNMKMSDPTPDSCPNCGAKASLSKIMSQTAFHLKGGVGIRRATRGLQEGKLVDFDRIENCLRRLLLARKPKVATERVKTG